MWQREQPLREEIVRLGRLMYDKGFISASEGNLSARLGPDRFLITPSGLHKGFLEPEQLLVVDSAGRVSAHYSPLARRLKPTSELPMHLEAYRQRPDIGAVIHAHPAHAIILSIAGIPIADCLIPEVVVLLGIIPTTPYATPSSDENARAIRTLIRQHDALVLQRHGTLTVGDTLWQAFMKLETVEQSARIGVQLAQLGVRNPLSPTDMRKLLALRREMGLMRPGESEHFCEVCGVCHDETEHPALLRAGATAQTTDAAGVDVEAVRALVARTVRQWLPPDE